MQIIQEGFNKRGQEMIFLNQCDEHAGCGCDNEDRCGDRGCGCDISWDCGDKTSCNCDDH